MGSLNESIEETKRKPLTPLEERFFKCGLKGFSDPEMIQLFLCHALSQKECEKLVREVIKRYKTLSDFLTAPFEELEQVPGITPRTIIRIKLMREMPPEYLKERIIDKPIHSSSREVFDYLYASMRGLKKEVFKVIYLNSQNQIVDTEDLFEGTINSGAISPRRVIEGAIKNRAASLIFVHNHPSGNPEPSQQDKEVTRDLVYAAAIMRLKALDHIIIGDNRYFSFAGDGLIEQYELDFLNLKVKGVSEAKRRLYRAKLFGGLT